MVEAVLAQMNETLSIYDNGGVFGRFEQAFADFHGRKFGLLANSGTSSILAMYEAANLTRGDEVLCPVYTFHATVSPLVYLGIRPRFCDADVFGNVNLAEIMRARTSATRAVVITHMWGVPAQDIEAIANYCACEKLLLFEDCSHAHGATLGGRKVGTFGDAAAWSLQGQKIITGGEGGILLTDNDRLYGRALLHGHYNKRPRDELSLDDPLRDYYLTGMGLKLRAHPLAVAIALQQFEQLEEFIAQKQLFADRLAAVAGDYQFIDAPHDSVQQQNSWYAFNFNFRPEHAFGVTREQFADALIAEGLIEVDIPGSTGLLNELPLFTRPGELIDRSVDAATDDSRAFPVAKAFADSIIKLPMWAYSDEEPIVEAYVEGLRKVCDYLRDRKTLSR